MRGHGWIAADLVEREQAVMAIERRILQRLGHQRTGELLELQRKIADAGGAVACWRSKIERHRVVQEVEDLRVRAQPARARARAMTLSMV